MREIKFRGKRVDNGEWVYGYYFIDERDIEDGFIWRDIPQIQQRYGDHYQYYDVDPSTVGQYTGLKDKNGKEIYEGDIVICPVHEESVDYLQLEAGDKNHVTRTICIPDCYQEGLPEDCKVIGNIHENPELLEVRG